MDAILTIGAAHSVFDPDHELFRRQSPASFLILIARFVTLDPWFLIASHPCITR
jgi:hypothetical protein